METTVSVRQEREARYSFVGSSNYKDKHRLCWEVQEAEATVPPALGGEVPSKDWLFVRGVSSFSRLLTFWLLSY